MFKTLDVKLRFTPEFCSSGIKINPNDSMVVTKKDVLLLKLSLFAALNLHLDVIRILFISLSFAFMFSLSIGALLNVQDKKLYPPSLNLCQ
jgi:hypothetical protein